MRRNTYINRKHQPIKSHRFDNGGPFSVDLSLNNNFGNNGNSYGIGSGLSITPYTGLTDSANQFSQSALYSGSSSLRDTAQNYGWQQATSSNGSSNSNFGSTMGAIGGAILNTPAGDKMLDTLDPTYHLAGGRESTVGNFFNDAGKGLFKTGVSTGNPWLMLGGAGAKVLGGLTNAAFGTKWNKENIQSVQNNITGMRTAATGLAKSTNTSSLLNNWGNVNTGFDFNNKFIGKDGWFTHKAKKKANNLRRQQDVARGVVRHGLVSGANNVDTMGDDNVFSHFSAFGGPLDIMANDNGMGAIGYGFMSDYMNMKNNQTQGKNTPTGYLGNLPSMFADGGGIHISDNKEGTYKAAAARRGISMSELADRIKANPENYSPALRKKANFYNNFARHKKSDGGNLIIGNNGDTLFALGGDLQTNSADYSTGLTHIDNGGTHAENPNDGVQYGVAPDGEPNLVEEGETVFNDQDYVFSNRIHPTKDVLKKFHMYSKGGKLTYADISKRLEKEAKERPNDPISRASLKDMLTMLMNAQEQQKAEEEAKRARKAFEALSPEEQAQILAQLQQQQEAQANAEQQGNPQEEQEVPVDENGNPVEEQPEEQAPTDEMSQQPLIDEQDIAQNDEGSMDAYGGQLHKFDNGGKAESKESLQEALFKALGFSVPSDWSNWLAKNDVDDVDWDSLDLDKIKNNKPLLDLIATRNAALANSIANGNNLGMFKFNPSGGVVISDDIDRGNWASANKGNGAAGWHNSTDPIWSQAIDKYMKDNGVKSKSDAIAAIDKLSRGDFEKLMSSTDAYIKSSEALKDDNNSLLYLNALINNPKTPKSAVNWAKQFVDDKGNWRTDEGHTDHSYDTVYGKVRGTYPGSYWHSFIPATRDKNTVNMLWNPDTKQYEKVIGDIGKDWTKENTYSWDDEPLNAVETYNYYRRPETDANGNPKKAPEIEAVHKPEWPRYAGLLGPIVGLGMQAAGIGKPDYAGLDAAINISNEANAQADYMPIGNYLRYRPMDIWAQENRNDANARATDRAITNSASPVGTRMAGLLANGYNSQVADAGLYRQALEYNDAQRQKVAEFNRGTDEFNADAYNKTSQFNADAMNRNRQFRANLAADAARTRLNGDANWYGSIYGNVGNLFTGIGELGRENAQRNMIADMAANGLFGTMNPNTPVAKGQNLLRYVDADGNTVDKDGNIIKKKAKGGKLKRKRGLTF